jgi:hypothetical protein
MPVDCPPAYIQQAPDLKPGEKFFCVYYSYGNSSGSGRGWWAHIEGHAYPLGAWRMDRGPYPFRWMAALDFPIERLTKDSPRD